MADASSSPPVFVAKFSDQLRQQLAQAKQQLEQLTNQAEIVKANIKKLEGALETCEVFRHSLSSPSASSAPIPT